MSQYWKYGQCPSCGRELRRRAPADYAICQHCYRENPPKIVEVKLQSRMVQAPQRIFTKRQREQIFGIYQRLVTEASNRGDINFSLEQFWRVFWKLGLETMRTICLDDFLKELEK